MDLAMDFLFSTKKPRSKQKTEKMDDEDKAKKLNEFKWNMKKTSFNMDVCHLPLLILKHSINGTSFPARTQAHIGQCFLPNTNDWYINFRHKVFCGYFDKTGEKFISAGQDKVIKIFDASDFSLQYEIPGRDVGWSFLDIAMSPDGQHLVYSSWSRNLHIVNFGSENTDDFHKGMPLNNTEHCGVFSVQFAGDGRRVFCGLNSGDVVLFDIELQKSLDRIYSGHSNEDINAVTIMDQSGNVFLTGADDCLLRVWDSRSLYQGPIGTFAGHQDGITHIDSKGDFRYFISNSKDQTIKLWDFRRQSPSNFDYDNYEPEHRQNWDYRWNAIPSKYRQELQSDMDASLMTMRGHTVHYTLIRARFSPAYSTGQRYVYSGSGDGKWYMWDLLSGEMVHQSAGHQTVIRDVSWHPWQPSLVTSSFDGLIIHWSRQKTCHDEEKISVEKRKMNDLTAIPAIEPYDSDESFTDEEEEETAFRRYCRVYYKNKAAIQNEGCLGP